MIVILSLLIVTMALGLIIFYVIYCLVHNFSKDLEYENLPRIDFGLTKKPEMKTKKISDADKDSLELDVKEEDYNSNDMEVDPKKKK